MKSKEKVYGKLKVKNRKRLESKQKIIDGLTENVSFNADVQWPS